MNETQQCLRAIKDGDMDVAMLILFPKLDKNSRVELSCAFVKNNGTSFTLAVKELTNLMLHYKWGKISDLELTTQAGYFRANPSLGYFGRACSDILYDVVNDDYTSSMSAVRTVYYSLYTKKGNPQAFAKVQELLLEAASIVWPEKGLIGAIYG